MITPVLVRTTVATLIAFVGGALGVTLGKLAARHLNLMVNAATGALLAVTVCDILPDAKRLLPWPHFWLAAASGYLLFWFIGKYVYHLCPACAIAHFDQATMQRLAQSAVLLMIALSIHSTMDGIAVVVGDRITGYANVGVLLAISLHKLPEGLALALLLVGAGYRRRTAFLWTLAIEATTEVGGLIGVFALRGASLPWLGAVFAHVGGGFLYLVINTLGAFTGHHDRQSNRSLFVVSGAAFSLTAFSLWIVGQYAR